MKKSYPSSLKKYGLILAMLLGISLGMSAQSLIHVELWKNAAGTGGSVNNYPVWIKLGAPLNYTMSGTTDNTGRYMDSIPNITVATPATFITYSCTGARIVSQITLWPNNNWYGDTLVVGCSTPKTVLHAFANATQSTTNSLMFSFLGGYTDSAMPSGRSYTYSWDFGDGQSAAGSLNTSHTYSNAGTYVACLTVTVTDSVQSLLLFSKTSCVTVVAGTASSCQADYRYFHSGSGTFAFMDSSNVATTPVGGSVSYGWDFGDGNGDTSQSANHTYQNAGIYNVCHWVVVRNAQSSIVCTDTICKQVNYGGSPTGCVTDFTFTSSGSGAFGFTDNSTAGNVPVGGSVSYGWDFGDGFGSTSQSTSHTYQAPGTYNVCHWVVVRNAQSNIVCTDTICKSVNYATSPSNCNINLLRGLSNGGNSIQFLVSFQSPPGTSSKIYSWDFGDGTSSFQGLPTHNYINSGQYQVCVTAYALDSIQDTICSAFLCTQIQVGTPINVVCQNNLTIRKYPDPYKVSLIDSTAIYPGGNITTEIFVVLQGAKSMFMRASAPSSSWPNWATFTYDLPAGNYTACLYHIYRDSTTNQVVCLARDCKTFNLPCQASYIVDTANSYQGNVFIWNTSTPTNNSSIHANSYQWDFGDGNSSNQPFPVHTYANPGVYAVCLTLTSVDSLNNMCTDTYCDTLGVDSLGNLIYKTTAGFTLNVLDPNAIGLEERIVEEFAVYPNPANDMVTMAWNEVVSGEMKWQITDLKGAILMKGAEDASNKKEMQLNVSRLKAGVYILSASHKNSPVAHYKLRIN